MKFTGGIHIKQIMDGQNYEKQYNSDLEPLLQNTMKEVKDTHHVQRIFVTHSFFYTCISFLLFNYNYIFIRRK